MAGGHGMPHDAAMETTTTNPTKSSQGRRFRRPVQGRVLGGVAAAIADATGIAVGVVRLAFILSVLFGGLGIVLYASAWALIPSQGDDHSAAERWLVGLTTPGHRIGAALIGAAVLIVLLPFGGPVHLAGLLLVGGWLLLRRPGSLSHDNS